MPLFAHVGIRTTSLAFAILIGLVLLTASTALAAPVRATGTFLLTSFEACSTKPKPTFSDTFFIQVASGNITISQPSTGDRATGPFAADGTFKAAGKDENYEGKLAGTEASGKYRQVGKPGAAQFCNTFYDFTFKLDAPVTAAAPAPTSGASAPVASATAAAPAAQPSASTTPSSNNLPLILGLGGATLAGGAVYLVWRRRGNQMVLVAERPDGTSIDGTPRIDVTQPPKTGETPQPPTPTYYPRVMISTADRERVLAQEAAEREAAARQAAELQRDRKTFQVDLRRSLAEPRNQSDIDAERLRHAASGAAGPTGPDADVLNSMPLIVEPGPLDGPPDPPTSPAGGRSSPPTPNPRERHTRRRVERSTSCQIRPASSLPTRSPAFPPAPTRRCRASAVASVLAATPSCTSRSTAWRRP